jgi:glycosyltransferase involved in cell wall biosynthesis
VSAIHGLIVQLSGYAQRRSDELLSFVPNAVKHSLRIVLLITMGIDRPSGMRYFHIAHELVRRGHTVRILALHPNLSSCSQRRFVCDGVEVWYVGQMHARKQGSVPSRLSPFQLLCVLIRSTFGMIWGIICSPADVYHLGKPQPVNGLAAFIGVVLLRRRRFYVDCDDDEVGSNRFSAGWQRTVFAFWQWLLPRLAAGVTVNTTFLAERMRQHGIAPIVYIPNGVDGERFKRPSATILVALRAALKLTNHRVIAYVGTLALHNHPVDLLLDAFAQIAHLIPDTTLLLIGGGEDLPLLRQRVAETGLQGRVLFTGYLPPESIRAYLALADISVDPVRDDNVARARSPLKLFESLALAVPAVTGNVGDRAAVLDDGRAGVLVAPGDSSELAHGVARLLRDRDHHTTLAHAGRQHVQRYTWCVLAAQWEDVYEGLGSGSHK